MSKMRRDGKQQSAPPLPKRKTDNGRRLSARRLRGRQSGGTRRTPDRRRRIHNAGVPERQRAKTGTGAPESAAQPPRGQKLHLRGTATTAPKSQTPDTGRDDTGMEGVPHQNSENVDDKHPLRHGRESLRHGKKKLYQKADRWTGSNPGHKPQDSQKSW